MPRENIFEKNAPRDPRKNIFEKNAPRDPRDFTGKPMPEVLKERSSYNKKEFNPKDREMIEMLITATGSDTRRPVQSARVYLQRRVADL